MSFRLGSVTTTLFTCAERLVSPKNYLYLFSLDNTKRYKANAFNHDWNEILNSYSPVSNDPNELWGDFKLKFLSIAGKHAPVKQRRVKREFKPWITSVMKHLIYYRDYLERQSYLIEICIL